MPKHGSTRLLPFCFEDQVCGCYMELEVTAVRAQQSVEVNPVCEWTEVVKRKRTKKPKLSGNGTGMVINL